DIDVGEDDVRRRTRQRIESIHAIFGLHDIEAMLDQRMAQHLPHHAAIVHGEDRLTHAAFSSTNPAPSISRIASTKAGDGSAIESAIPSARHAACAASSTWKHCAPSLLTALASSTSAAPRRAPSAA